MPDFSRFFQSYDLTGKLPTYLFNIEKQTGNGIKHSIYATLKQVNLIVIYLRGQKEPLIPFHDIVLCLTPVAVIQAC